MKPTDQDARIPVLLIQRVAAAAAQDVMETSRGVADGWDLILPKEWGQAFWKSFIYAGSRAGGAHLCVLATSNKTDNAVITDRPTRAAQCMV